MKRKATFGALRGMGVLITVWLLTAALNPCLSQTREVYNWKHIDSLIDEQQYDRAYRAADSLYRRARLKGLSRQSLVAARLMTVCAMEYKEDAADSALLRYQRLLPQLKGVERAVCHFYIASFYADHMRYSYWGVTSDDADEHYSLWSQQRANDTILAHLESAFADCALLAQQPSEAMPYIVSPLPRSDENTQQLVDITPTLLDVMAEELRRIASSTEHTPYSAAELPAAELLLAEPSRFVAMPLPAYNHRTALAHLLLTVTMERERQHLADDDPSVLLHIAAERCTQLQKALAFQLDQQQMLTNILARYNSSHSLALAHLHYNIAVSYKAHENYIMALRHCDTVLTRYRGSAFYSRCANIKEEILFPSIQLYVSGISVSERQQVTRVDVRNVDQLYFRIISWPKGNTDYDKKKILNAKVLQSWDMAVPARHDHAGQQLFVIRPPMPQGHYLMLVSPTADFDTMGFVFSKLTICDAAIIASPESDAWMQGYLVDSYTGKPLAGQKVRCMEEKSGKNTASTLATAITDQNGYYDLSKLVDFTKVRGYLRIQAEYNGMTVDGPSQWYWNHSDDNDDENDIRNVTLLTDRPVYKPGDTVHASIVLINNTERNGYITTGGKTMTIEWQNINGVTQQRDTVVTDDYGVATVSYVLDGDAMPGRYNIHIVSPRHFYRSFKVEAYKQPKFHVQLSEPQRVPRWGDTALVEGMAASYSATPIANCEVRYTITRERRSYWKRGRWMPAGSSETVASGQTATDAEGFFLLAFVPMPSTGDDKDCYYYYKVEAHVTDKNGESHSDQITIGIGDKNSSITIEEQNATSGKQLKISYINLVSGKMMNGKLAVRLTMLQEPSRPLLPLPLFDSTPVLPLPPATYEKTFPYYDILNRWQDKEQWPQVGSPQLFAVSCNESAAGTLNLSHLATGVYKIEATTVDEHGDTIVGHLILDLTARHARRPASMELLWAEIDKTNAVVGDTLHLRYGSRFEDMTVFINIGHADSCERHLVMLSNALRTMDIPVTADMVGPTTLSLSALRFGESKMLSFTVDVKDAARELTVTLETFRNKLTPGDKERWTLRIASQPDNRGLEANLAMTMYSAALDSYGPLSWSLSPWATRNNGHRIMFYSNSGSYYYNDRFYISRKYHLSDQNLTSLHQRCLFSPFHPRVTMQGNMRKQRYAMLEAQSAKGFVDGDEEVYSLSDALASNAEVVTELALVHEEAIGVIEFAEAEQHSTPSDLSPSLRSNLSPLAFFAPSLRSDSLGQVEVSFTVPDQLTEWNIRGLAWSRQWQVGTLQASAVTQKPLMVEPNVPRYLYQGDTCRFAVKVSNMSDVEQQVTLSLEMLDGLRGTTLPIVLDGNERHLSLPPGSSTSASFLIAAPEGDCYMAHYKVVARGQGCSDGEVAALPLLSRKQLVTESMSFYINGAGEKHYQLSHLTGLDTAARDFSLRHNMLSVQMTPNPLWLALQCLPYVEEHHNPSNIYLVNSIYVNSIASKIVHDNPALLALFEAWSNQDSSALFPSLANSEVAAATPWLRQALGEQQQHSEMANYFDNKRLSRRLQKDIDLLLDAQRSDGSWCWISGANYPSLYTTQYILKTFGIMQRQGVKLDARTRRALDKALYYVDRETYDYYLKYIKDSQLDAVNVDYLYMRSFYSATPPSGKFAEAYNFFYDNTKRHNKQYSSLHSQALLALIFHRHGDTDLAHTMLQRVGQKALRSDEQGLYWRDNISGWFWYQRPVETQALLIQAYDEVLRHDDAVPLMQQWLLKQKQTTSWNSDIATIAAIQALLLGGNSSLFAPSNMTLSFGSHTLASDTASPQLAYAQRIPASDIRPDDGRITLRKHDDGIAWGSMFWQYFENQEKIPASESGMTLSKTLYRVATDGTLVTLAEGAHLKVGDRLKVRILLTVDRNLEYVQISEPRHAALEPVSTASGWRWSQNLCYYLAVTATAQQLYVDRLEKGTYYLEFEYYVNSAGVYTAPPTTAACLYAPEFRALSPSPTMVVE